MSDITIKTTIQESTNLGITASVGSIQPVRLTAQIQEGIPDPHIRDDIEQLKQDVQSLKLNEITFEIIEED